jgi:uncharacterized membrane protein YqiK
MARAGREAHIHDAEARAREIELQAEADAARVKLAAAAQGERVKLEAEADAHATQARGAGEAEAVRARSKAEAERVKLTAEADAARVQLSGDAEAGAAKARGLAEGEAIRARGTAEADAIKARAEALAGHQEAIIGQQLAENWPQIVEAAAKPFGAIDRLIVLNGVEGISEALTQALGQGVAGLQMARRVLGETGGAPGASPNGSRRQEDDLPPLTPRPSRGGEEGEKV